MANEFAHRHLAHKTDFDTWHFEFQHNLGIDGPLWQYLILSFRLFWGPYQVVLSKQAHPHIRASSQASVYNPNPAAPGTQSVKTVRHCLDTVNLFLNLIVKIIIPRPQPNMDP